ncbi:MAG TPA: cell surface protein SprA [candidate division Zixibacteria bacterium]|nr:cell surface protein SprA [candidate division Zixibacteria bacterium]
MSVGATFKKITYFWLSVAVLLGLRGVIFASPPRFNYDLEEPPSFISPYPKEKKNFSVALYYRDYPLLRGMYKTKIKVERSSFEYNSITFTGAYYKKKKFEYFYTSRSVDANAFHEYRKRLNLESRMRETTSRALAKDQKNKAGGLFAINIPIKSKAMESLFGEGGAGLKVSGYHQITLSGRSQWDDRTETATYRQNKFPSLNMEQISRFDINGTIGSKITVSVSQDSKTDIPLANRIMLRYKGDEDDIIKTIEAGNTTLSLPNTQFVGYSTRIKGLFGIKSTAQIGGLELTAIASQEKGSTERTTIKAGGASRKTILRDWQYLDGKIFDLGRLSGDEMDFDTLAGDVIVELAVYRHISSVTGDALGTEANMYVDPNDTSKYSNETEALTLVEEVPSDEYYVDNNSFWIMFEKANAGTYNAEIGYWMIVQRGGSGAIDTIGDISAPPYSLKLLKSRSPLESDATFGYAWRNVYSLGSGKLDLDGLDIKIYKGTAGTESDDENLDHDENGAYYITSLGLDRFNQDGELKPDQLVDVYSDIIVADQGLLIFPDREPFANADALSETVPEIYQYKRGATQILEVSKYYLEITSSTRSSDISLGRPNIIEGSERITLNGVEMVRGEDYTINYDFGRVTLKDPDAIDPNADLAIDFEYSPFIQAQKKTLFGLRSEYEYSKNLKLGSTILYKSDKATQRKPKIGQETSRMFVWDGDISFRVKSNFLTKMANALPLFSTERESNLAVSAEVAQSYPNPNVDGVAYLDDFEGSQESYSLSVFRESWLISAKPATLDDTYHRAWLNWYNPYDQIATQEIWNREVTASDSRTQVLHLYFEPDEIDRRLGNVDTSVTEIDPTRSWAGIMRGLIGSATDMTRADHLEFRMRGNKGILHIDLGEISEDINGNGVSDDEDDLIGLPNNVLDDGEDLGLDGLADSEEPGYNAVTNPDPHKDNWKYEESDRYNYRYINGTENNKNDPGTIGRPDREDFNKDQSTGTRNNYFSYRIDLSDRFSEFLVQNSENDYGWTTYRIPLRDSSAIDEIINEPAWEDIPFVRIWVESPEADTIDVEIASAKIISPNWEDTIAVPFEYANAVDTATQAKFSVAVISTQENDPLDSIPYYEPPPGVAGYYDPTAKINEPEQSLLLTYKNLKVYDDVSADTGLAQRLLYDTPNLMGYGGLRMYVRAPRDLADDSTLMFLFRIGKDEENYYELRTTIDSSEWIDDKGWMDVGINFDEITGLREVLIREQDDNPDLDINFKDSVVNGNHYRVFGSPDITKVKYLAFGVVPLRADSLISGDMWVDELRVTDVRTDVGTAARISFSGNVADLFTYNAGYNYRNAYFRKISGSTRAGSTDNLGSGKSTNSYSYGLNFKLDKFMPRSLGASLPVSYRYSKSTSIPQLKYNSDIILPEQFRDEEKTETVTKSFSISETVNKKTKNPVFSILLNNIRTNFSYSRSDGLSPSTPMSLSESYRAGMSYTYNIPKVPHIRPFFWTQPIPLLKRFSPNKFYFFPSTISLTGDVNRSLRITRNINHILTNTLTKTFNGTFRTTYKISDNLTSSYNMTTNRDLSNPDLVNFSFNPKDFKLGRETRYTQAFSSGYSPVIFGFLTHKFSFSTSYTEDLNVISETRNMSSNKSYSVGGVFDLNKFLGGKPTSRRSSRRIRPKREEVDKDKPKSSLMKKLVTGPASVLRFLTSWIEPINYDFKEAYRYSYVGLKERASLKFRFGLTEDIGAEIDSESGSTGRSTITTKSTNYGLSSGTQFFGGLKTGVSFNRTINRDLIKAVNPTKSVSTTFPDFNFTINQLTTFKFLNPFIRKFAPRTKYSRSTKEYYNLTTGFKTKESETISQNPLLSFTFNIFRDLQINVRTNRSVSEDISYNSSTGEITRKSRSTSSNASASTKYSFSWPTGVKFPILGRIKFRSTMAISLEVSIRQQTTEEASGDTPLISKGDNRDFMVTPTISYAFSNQIKGGISGRWQDTNNKQQNRKSHVRELRIWVDIRF